MKRAQTLRLLLALLLAAVAVVWGGLSFQRKIASFQPLGFTAEVPGGFARVTRVDDPRTALRPGDQIYLVNGGDVTNAPELARRLKGQPESHLTVLRGDAVVKVLYHRPPFAVDVAYLVLALISVGYLLIGLYTLLRHGGRQGLLFYFWCLASALLYLLTPVPPADGLYKTVFAGDELARLLLPALTFHLFLVFPTPLGRRWTRAIPFVYLPAAVFAALQLDIFVFHGRFLFGGRPTAAALVVLDQLEIAHLVLFALASIAILVWRLARPAGAQGTAAWEQQRQLRWIVFGMAGGYLPFFVLYVTPLLLGLRRPALLTAVAVLPLALVPLAFAYAILRYKLWDIEVIVRDTISATLTLLLGVIGFSLANLLIVRGVPQDFAVARNLLSFTAGLGIASLLVPTRRSLSSALERLHYRSTFGKRRALSGLGRELLLERDLGQLCSALLKQIEEGVAIERLNLYLVQGENLVAVRPEGRLPRSLPLDVLGEELWREEVRRISGVALPAETMPAAQHLFLAGYRYAFPLAVLGSRVGVALAGYKADQNPLNSEDVELVRHLLNQAALAIENAQLLGRLKDQLQEVIRLKRYTEGIFESSPAGIAVLDPDGRIVSANAAFAALTGRERDNLAGRALSEVLPVELPAPGEGPREVSYCGVGGSDTGERHLQLSLAGFTGQEIDGDEIALAGRAAGELRLRILVVHDVSERVAMENALKEKDRLAALGMLAAGVAHEVNTPITGISSYAQMLLSDTAESDPRYDLLKKVERQTFRAARIVNNLLEYARNKSGERGPVALLPIVAEAIELLGDRLARRGIAVDFRRPAGEVVVVGCDGELQQVFTNLVANAADAMEEGGRLTVTVETAGGRARVAVEDTGPGIPPDRLERIFQPFFSTKLTRGGTGLGLSISYDIVRRHGGDLKASSRQGEGACFVVELPLQPQVAA